MQFSFISKNNNSDSHRQIRFLAPTSLVLSAALIFSTVFIAIQPNQAHARRPDIRKMSCQSVQQLVRRQGAIVLGFSQHTYDRVVKNQFYCRSNETTRQLIKQTADNRKCRIGRLCVDAEEDPLFEFYRRSMQ